MANATIAIEKDWDEYRSRAVFGFNRPIEFNHEGKRLDLARKGMAFTVMPFGPSSELRQVICVVEVDEIAETITVVDFHKPQNETPLSFDLWSRMKPRHYSY